MAIAGKTEVTGRAADASGKLLPDSPKSKEKPAKSDQVSETQAALLRAGAVVLSDIEGRVVPPYQRWANSWRAGEIAAKSFALFSNLPISTVEQGMEYFSSEILSGSSPDSFLNKLGKELGHARLINQELIKTIRISGLEVEIVAGYISDIDAILINGDEIIKDFTQQTTQQPAEFSIQRFIFYYCSLATHEYTHRDQKYPLLPSEKFIVEFRRQFKEGRILPEEVFLQEISKKNRSIGYNFTAAALEERALPHLSSVHSPLADEIAEKEAYLIEVLLNRMYSGNLQDEYYIYRTTEGDYTTTIPLHLRDAQEVYQRFNHPRLRDLPFHIAYYLAKNRAVITAFRSMQVGVNILAPMASGADFYRSASDPIHYDKADISLKYFGTMYSSASALINIYALFQTPLLRTALLRVGGPLAAVPAALLSFQNFYHTTFKREDTSAQEKTWSGVNTTGGLMMGGAAAYMLATAGAATAASGGLLAPVALLVGSGILIGSQIMQARAKEERLAQEIYQAMKEKDFRKLKEITEDPEHELDDDTIVMLFRNHLNKDSSLLQDKTLLASPEFQTLRKKMAGELESGWTSGEEKNYISVLANSKVA